MKRYVEGENRFQSTALADRGYFKGEELVVGVPQVPDQNAMYERRAPTHRTLGA